MCAIATPESPAAHDPCHAAFLAALPGIQRIARIRFRHVECLDSREDCICETVALCWVWFVRLTGKGRRPEAFATVLARYGSTAVQCGRRAAGQDKAGEIMARPDPRAFRNAERRGESFPERTPYVDALTDNTQTPVPQQVQFRCDLPAWKERLSDMKRRLVDALVLGHRTKDLAVQFGLSEGRISQLRKEFSEDYALFCGG